MSLSPQAGQPASAADARTRVATNTPAQIGPSGGYLVQVSSQKNEADAQASYRVLQGKYPAVLGSRSPVIKRADLGRDRDEQRPDRFQVGQKLDAMVTGFDRSKKPNFSVKARQLAEEKEAVEQYGSSDAGASLGDILGAALKAKQ